MTAQHVDLYIEQGADWPGIGFPICDSLGAPFDLTGCTAKGQIRKTANDVVVLFEWSSEDTLDPEIGAIVFVDNLVIISMTAEQSEALDFRTAQYDVKLTNPSGLAGQKVLRVSDGTVTLSQEVTRDG